MVVCRKPLKMFRILSLVVEVLEAEPSAPPVYGVAGAHFCGALVLPLPCAESKHFTLL